MSQYERAAETDVFRTGDTAHKIHKQISHHVQVAFGYI